MNEENIVINENLDEEIAPLSPEQSTTDSPISVGKFKDSATLLDAYNNLEREFTKKSQKLKMLESGEDTATQNKTSSNSQLINFLADINPDLGELLSGAAVEENLEVGAQESSAQAKYNKAFEDKILPKGEDKIEEFVSKIFAKNSGVKERIYAKLLDELPQTLSPKTTKYRGQTVLTPPLRPKNIEEAGRLAENIIYNRSK